MAMKLFYIALVVLMLLSNLVGSLSALAAEAPHSSNHHDYFIGQKVVWLYKARADSKNIQRIAVEVVKLGSKRVQVRVNKHSNEFVNRWVNRDRLENR